MRNLFELGAELIVARRRRRARHRRSARLQQAAQQGREVGGTSQSAAAVVVCLFLPTQASPAARPRPRSTKNSRGGEAPGQTRPLAARADSRRRSGGARGQTRPRCAARARRSLRTESAAFTLPKPPWFFVFFIFSRCVGPRKQPQSLLTALKNKPKYGNSTEMGGLRPASRPPYRRSTPP